MESKKFTDAINGQQEKLEKYGLNLVQWCLIQPYLKLKFKEKEDMPVNHINLKILYYQELSSYKISTKYFHYKKKYNIISHYIILYYIILNYIIFYYIILYLLIFVFTFLEIKLSIFSNFTSSIFILSFKSLLSISNSFYFSSNSFSFK